MIMYKLAFEKALDDLYEIEGIQGCILYRIDGTPIAVRTPPHTSILKVMLWLEKQIKHVLQEMNKERLKATTFDFMNIQILITPTSRSTVLVVIINPDAHHQLISIEISRAKSLINTSVS
jgi:predicted regulator of Ras-like GTPase activity (Roadblock/LC7/MglB family)